MNIYLRGLIIGISIAAPVGPIGVLCIRRTLSSGRLSGLISGLGAATADAMYGIIAGYGLNLISSYLVSQQSTFRLIGGLFLCYLGIRTATSKPAETKARARGDGLVGDYFSVMLLTLTNPVTILSFAAIYAGLGLVQKSESYLAATTLVAGVFSGSALWWLTLSLGIGVFRGRVTPRSMRWINRISGGAIFTFGILALLSLFSPDSPL